MKPKKMKLRKTFKKMQGFYVVLPITVIHDSIAMKHDGYVKLKLKTGC